MMKIEAISNGETLQNPSESIPQTSQNFLTDSEDGFSYEDEHVPEFYLNDIVVSQEISKIITCGRYLTPVDLAYIDDYSSSSTFSVSRRNDVIDGLKSSRRVWQADVKALDGTSEILGKRARVDDNSDIEKINGRTFMKGSRIARTLEANDDYELDKVDRGLASKNSADYLEDDLTQRRTDVVRQRIKSKDRHTRESQKLQQSFKKKRTDFRNQQSRESENLERKIEIERRDFETRETGSLTTSQAKGNFSTKEKAARNKVRRRIKESKNSTISVYISGSGDDTGTDKSSMFVPEVESNSDKRLKPADPGNMTSRSTFPRKRQPNEVLHGMRKLPSIFSSRRPIEKDQDSSDEAVEMLEIDEEEEENDYMGVSIRYDQLSEAKMMV